MSIFYLTICRILGKKKQIKVKLLRSLQVLNCILEFQVFLSKVGLLLVEQHLQTDTDTTKLAMETRLKVIKHPPVQRMSCSSYWIKREHTPTCCPASLKSCNFLYALISCWSILSRISIKNYCLSANQKHYRKTEDREWYFPVQNDDHGSEGKDYADRGRFTVGK